MTKEARLLARLTKLLKRRDLLAWRLADVDRQINEATRALAAERGVAFIRPETVRLEIAEHEKEAARG